MSEQTATEAQLEPTRPHIRVPHKYTRFLKSMDVLSIELATEFNAPPMDELLKLTAEEFEAARERFIDAIAASLADFTPPAVPLPAVQLDDFRIWQWQRAPYYVWPAAAMEALSLKLSELGEGVVLIPCYALTVGVKLRDGRVIRLDRNGRETKG
jgi:hypothetical protein